MKLVTFELATPLGRKQRTGVLLGQAPHTVVLDANRAYAHWLQQNERCHNAQAMADVMVPSHMLGLIQGGAITLESLRVAIAWVSQRCDIHTPQIHTDVNGARLMFGLDEVTLKTPLPNPNSLRDFLAFEAHVKRGYKRRNQDMPKQWYQFPVYYKGNRRSLIGPDCPVVWPRYTQKLDYELEMACIVGKGGRGIPAEEATPYIFGYSILNDWSARDIQMDEVICRMGPAKGKDFATSIGPYILTADAVPNVRDMKMTARINGEVWSEGNAGSSYWTWEQMIAHISQEEDIYPGDILGSGTVGGGCGYELDRWIQPGDVVELEIEHLGILRNTVTSHEQLAQHQKVTHAAL